jgi:hypothetical protein
VGAHAPTPDGGARRAGRAAPERVRASARLRPADRHAPRPPHHSTIFLLVDILLEAVTTLVAAKRRNVACGYGRRRRLAAGWRLVAVRSGGSFLACGCGLRVWWRLAARRERNSLTAFFEPRRTPGLRGNPGNTPSRHETKEDLFDRFRCVSDRSVPSGRPQEIVRARGAPSCPSGLSLRSLLLPALCVT